MQPVPPPERRTRAGRNLPAAIGVGLGLAAVILLSLYVWKPAFVGVVVAAVVLAVWELANALRRGPGPGPAWSRSPWARWRSSSSAYAGGSEADARRARADRAGAPCSGGSPENPKGYVARRHGRRLRRAVRAVPRRLRGAAAATRRRRRPRRRLHRARRAQRHRRLRRRGPVRPAPDGADGQPEEVLGGLRRLGAVLRRRRGASPCRCCSTGAVWEGVADRPRGRWRPPPSATSASR